jgi:hypothetical protein
MGEVVYLDEYRKEKRRATKEEFDEIIETIAAAFYSRFDATIAPFPPEEDSE